MCNNFYCTFESVCEHKMYGAKARYVELHCRIFAEFFLCPFCLFVCVRCMRLMHFTMHCTRIHCTYFYPHNACCSLHKMYTKKAKMNNRKKKMKKVEKEKKRKEMQTIRWNCIDELMANCTKLYMPHDAYTLMKKEGGSSNSKEMKECIWNEVCVCE